MTQSGVMTMAQHEIVKCSGCQKVMYQCRCIGPKTTRYEVCESCKK